MTRAKVRAIKNQLTKRLKVILKNLKRSIKRIQKVRLPEVRKVKKVQIKKKMERKSNLQKARKKPQTTRNNKNLFKMIPFPTKIFANLSQSYQRPAQNQRQ